MWRRNISHSSASRAQHIVVSSLPLCIFRLQCGGENSFPLTATARCALKCASLRCTHTSGLQLACGGTHFENWHSHKRPSNNPAQSNWEREQIGLRSTLSNTSCTNTAVVRTQMTSGGFLGMAMARQLELCDGKHAPHASAVSQRQQELSLSRKGV